MFGNFLLTCVLKVVENIFVHEGKFYNEPVFTLPFLICSSGFRKLGT